MAAAGIHREVRGGKTDIAIISTCARIAACMGEHGHGNVRWSPDRDDRQYQDRSRCPARHLMGAGQSVPQH